jgi:hypothetical protein
MSIQTNFPAIKPTLLLDFANVERLDPRITFSRASTATYYGTQTAKAEENLLLQSQDYSTSWTVTSLTPVTGKTAPDATSTATEFTASAANAVLTQGYTAIAGSYTFSIFLRRVTGSGDIQIAADNGTWTTKVITGTWARYDVTQTVAAGSKTAGVRVVTDTDAIEVWGAQLEQRSAVTAYTVTTTQPITNYIPVLETAASGVARFDHNPTTFESLGLLIEEQRTNLALSSGDALAGGTGTSVVANQIVAPDGSLADFVMENTSNSEHFAGDRNITVTSGVTYCWSFYAKLGNGSPRNVYVRTALQGSSGVIFNVLTGTSTVIASVVSSGSQDVGNGWRRCWIVYTATGTGSAVFRQQLTIGTNPIYTGDGTSGLYIWGAQLEAGAFPTSYIPTVASQVTRSADAATMTGTNFSSWYSQGQGTLYAEFNPLALATSSGVVINDNTTSNRIRLATTSVSDQGTVTTSGTAQAVLDGGTPAANTSMKLAMTYQVNNFALSLNGATAATDTTGTVPVVSQLQIGAETTTVGNLRIKKMAYYPIVSTAIQLQALTS